MYSNIKQGGGCTPEAVLAYAAYSKKKLETRADSSATDTKREHDPEEKAETDVEEPQAPRSSLREPRKILYTGPDDDETTPEDSSIESPVDEPVFDDRNVEIYDEDRPSLEDL